MTSPRKQLRKSEWERRLNEIPVSKEDLNKLILDYLLIEGYKSAAQSFSKETSLKPAIDLESIENRMVIRNAVQRGDIETAVGWVNELDPEILDHSPLLFFHLQQQRLIELIRTGDLLAALKFASEELAPRGEEFPEFLPELEKTMALLAFDLNPSSSSNSSDSTLKPPSNISSLLSSEQRFKIAGELNAAILESQNQNQNSKLPKLLRILEYGEDLLANGGVKDDSKDNNANGGLSSSRNPTSLSRDNNTTSTSGSNGNGGIDFPRLDLGNELSQEGRRMRGVVNGPSGNADGDVTMAV